MELKSDQTVIRQIKESDIGDYKQWFSTEIEWMDWDAPWEVWSEQESADFIEKLRIRIDKNPEIVYRMEIEDENGVHIGWVSSYNIDGVGLAVGAVIPPISARGKGHGEKVLRLFIDYLFEKTQNLALYTQTWSGNLPMIRLAEKLGFVEYDRKVKIREVRGDLFDALTFKICKA